MLDAQEEVSCRLTEFQAILSQKVMNKLRKNNPAVESYKVLAPTPFPMLVLEWLMFLLQIQLAYCIAWELFKSAGSATTVTLLSQGSEC